MTIDFEKDQQEIIKKTDNIQGLADQVERLQTYQPPWPIPKVFRIASKKKLISGIFEGNTINTPSMLCVEDAIDGLNWSVEIGGLDELFNRSNTSLSLIETWVQDTSWVNFLNVDKLTRSNTGITFKIIEDWFVKKNEKEQRDKLVKILAHDVERIERLITDYSQMLKDEVALSKEKMKVINLKLIAKSVVDDFNNIYESKRGIKIELTDDKNLNEYLIKGIENRIEQIIANLLDNSISFSADNKKIKVKISKNLNNQIILNVIDEGEGFKEKDTDKIFKRFYSNRPETFGEHSGLGLNIVKNLVELHGGTINASNNINQKGANIKIIFPKI